MNCVFHLKRFPGQTSEQVRSGIGARATGGLATPRVFGAKDPVSRILGGESHHVAIEAQLSLTFQARNPSHPRSIEHLLVRHVVLSTVPEDA